MRKVAGAAVLSFVAGAMGACTKPPKNVCPGTYAGRCVGNERCSFDHTRGCRVCTCEPLNGDLAEPLPDDRSRPPDFN